MPSTIDLDAPVGTPHDSTSRIVHLPWYLGDGSTPDLPPGSNETPPTFQRRAQPLVSALGPEQPRSRVGSRIRMSPATPDSAVGQRASPSSTRRDASAFVEMRALLDGEPEWPAPMLVGAAREGRPGAWWVGAVAVAVGGAAGVAGWWMFGF